MAEKRSTKSVLDRGSRRDTETGKLLAVMGSEEQEAVWARRIQGLVEQLKTQSHDYSTAVDARLSRLAVRGTLTEDENEPIDAQTAEARVRADEGVTEALDLTDYLSWFKTHVDDKSRADWKAADLYFLDHDEYRHSVESNPQLFYRFDQHLVNTIIWADNEIGSLRAKLANSEAEVSKLAENLAVGNDAHMDELNTMYQNRDRYRALITGQDAKIKDLEAQVADLQTQLKAKADNLDPSDSSSGDSEDSFLHKFAPGAPGRKKKRVSFGHDDHPDTRSRSRSLSRTSTVASHTHTSTARCPPKVETFTGERDKYDEWIGKFMSQLEANPEYFEGREERQLNYLIQSLSGAAYDLVKDQFGYAARKANSGLSLAQALKVLDRAYYPIDIARTARAKLEQLTMGQNEQFCEFYPKFQAQANRLRLGEEHLIDELTKRLSNRFATRILDGSDTSYNDIVDRCYRMDSQLSMWAASNSRKTDTGRTTSAIGSTARARPSAKTTDNKEDPNTVKLGEHAKSLEKMTVAELRSWKNNLPRGRAVVERIRKEGRCLGCQQEGHMKYDPSCILTQKLGIPAAKTSISVTNTTDSEPGKAHA